jgi:Ca2+-binding EF-hand superfamily protein
MLRHLGFCCTVLLWASIAVAQPDRPAGEQPPPGGERNQDNREDRDPGDRGPPDRGPGDRGPSDRGPGGRDFGRGFTPPNPLFDVIDADRDGTITPQELEKAVAALKTLDRNGDGSISREEARPQFGRGGFGGPGGGTGGQFTPEGFVASMLERDTNKDGKLNAEELGERGARMLETSDTNGDKQIDADELKAAAARMVEQFRNRSRDGGGRPESDEGTRPQRPQSERESDRI